MRTLRIQGMAIAFTYTIESEDGKFSEGVIGVQSIQANSIPLSLSGLMVEQIVDKVQAVYKEEFKVEIGVKGNE